MILLAIIGIIAIGAAWGLVFDRPPPDPPPPKPRPKPPPDWVAMSKRLPYRVPIGREEFHVKNSIFSPFRE